VARKLDTGSLLGDARVVTGGRSWIGWLGGVSALALLAILVFGRAGPPPAGAPERQEEPVARSAPEPPPAEGLEGPSGAVPQPGAPSPQKRALPLESSPEQLARRAPRPKYVGRPLKATGEPRRFDEDALLAAGVDYDDVVRLRESFEAAEVERGRLREAAEQEGRPLLVDERDALWQLESELEQELGAEAYDQMLYASGDPNRAMVRWVSTESPAAAAGLAAGDLILSYDGLPIYRYDEFRYVVEETPPGTMVPIEYQRGEEVHSGNMVAGPFPRRYRGVDGFDVVPSRVEP
jgi:hypothetical protein